MQPGWGSPLSPPPPPPAPTSLTAHRTKPATHDYHHHPHHYHHHHHDPQQRQASLLPAQLLSQAPLAPTQAAGHHPRHDGIRDSYGAAQSQPRQFLTFPARPITRISSRKTKRVPVTSCDVCRLKKLKCNAKEQEEGETCMQCAKSGAACTFEDRDETRKIAKVSNRNSNSNSNSNSNIDSSNNCANGNGTGQGKRRNISVSAVAIEQRSMAAGRPRRDTLVSTPGYVPKGPRTGSSELIQQMAAQLWPELLGPGRTGGATTVATQMQNEHQQQQQQQQQQQYTQAIVIPNSTAQFLGSSSNMLQHESASAPALAPMAEDTSTDEAPWAGWNLPPCITDFATGRQHESSGHSLVCMLLDRFYLEGSLNTIIVPAAICDGQSGDRTSHLPGYLIHTMVATAGCSALTLEPELVAWQAQGWHTATEAVHARVTASNGGPLDLHLIQALLLLSVNWPGQLERIERLNTFDTAVGLATCLKLHVASQLDCVPGGRAQRIALFWALYCLDKAVAVVFKRAPTIPSDSHDVPLPCVQDVYALLDRSSRASHSGSSSSSSSNSNNNNSSSNSNMAAWTQRLLLCLIALAKMLEDVQANLYSPEAASWIKTLDDVYLRITPLEERLCHFTTEHSWLLATMPTLPLLCRNLAQAVLLQLHLVQLHLYLPALHVDFADGATTDGDAAKQMSDGGRALIATIESAWHLAHQPADGLGLPLSPDMCSLLASKAARENSSDVFQACDEHGDIDEERAATAGFGFSRACKTIGTAFFGFLATSWSDWEGGHGCMRFTASSTAASSSSTRAAPPATEEQQQGARTLHPAPTTAATTMTVDMGAAHPQASVVDSESRHPSLSASSAQAAPNHLPAPQAQPQHRQKGSEVNDAGLLMYSNTGTNTVGGGNSSSGSKNGSAKGDAFSTDDGEAQQQQRHTGSSAPPPSFSPEQQRQAADAILQLGPGPPIHSTLVMHGHQRHHTDGGSTASASAAGWETEEQYRLLPPMRLSYTYAPMPSLDAVEQEDEARSRMATPSSCDWPGEAVAPLSARRPCSLPPHDQSGTGESATEEETEAAEAVLSMRNVHLTYDGQQHGFEQHPHAHQHQHQHQQQHQQHQQISNVAELVGSNVHAQQQLHQHCHHPHQHAFPNGPPSATTACTTFSPRQF